jgi:hypothetical protein
MMGASGWRPRASGTLQGFFVLTLPSGFVINDCTLHEKGERRWVWLPGKPQLEDGKHRKDQTTIATNLRRINKNGVLGAVTLHVPQWGATLLGCSWAHGSGGERVVLPRREWLDRHGLEHSAEIIVFDHQGLQQRFEAEALAAVKRLIRATTR